MVGIYKKITNLITNKVAKVFDNLYAISSSLRVCNKKEKTAYGYIWAFEDSND